MSSEFIGRRPMTTPNELRERIEAEGRGDIRVIPLPWPSLHRAVGFGLRMGNITLLAGASGASKSYCALNIALHAETHGFTWAYMPLEDNAERWLEKALAVHCCDWRLVGNPEEDTEESRKSLSRHKLTHWNSNRELENQLYNHVRENPRIVALREGATNVDVTHYQGILDWVRRECESGTELVIIDPVAQISFSGTGKQWEQETHFMQELTGIASEYESHVLLVAHITKRPGRLTTISTLDDLQGAAAFNRFVHYVLLLDRHDSTENEVYNAWKTATDHKLTMSVAKARDGFSGTRIAMDLSKDGPKYIDHGVIKPKKPSRRPTK